MTIEPQPQGSSRLTFSEGGYIDVYRVVGGLVVIVDYRHGRRTITTLEPRDARYLGKALLRRSRRRFWRLP